MSKPRPTKTTDIRLSSISYAIADITTPDTSRMSRQKQAFYAELYGAGDIKVGLITGQYPNPHLAKLYLDEVKRRMEEKIERAFFRGGFLGGE